MNSISNVDEHRQDSPLADGLEIAEEVNVAGVTSPVFGVKLSELMNNWGDPRSGNRSHEGLDILASHGTAVVAVANGEVLKLFDSELGGTTLYVSLAGQDYLAYYAHLEGYADGIRSGKEVKKGDVLGYIGTSGNAPNNVPHLHFEIHKMDGSKDWWKGQAINPYVFLQKLP